ncbi:MAG: hypothetical protein ACYTG0_16130, partial [Planctomycetota bacterium]
MTQGRGGVSPARILSPKKGIALPEDEMTARKVPIDDVRGRVDFAIITIREDEFEAVLDRFSPRQPVEGGKQLYEYCRLTTEAGAECCVAVVRSLEQGQTAAQSVARDV